MIHVSGLSFQYGPQFRLQDISVRMEDSSFWAIIGPNGSGKSTLLKLMSKVAEPEAGTVEIDGHNLASLPLRELARRMAVVGSETQFVFPYHVEEVVLMGRIPFAGRLGAFSRADYLKAEDALRKTAAIEFRGRYIHQLSSGERQRVLLARALAQGPRILLLDEPTAHLDLHYEIEIFRILRSLNQAEGIQVVAVSHNLNIVSEFCRRVLVLKDGKIFCAGTPDEVFTPPRVREAFGIDCEITRNPFSGAPSIQLKTT